MNKEQFFELENQIVEFKSKLESMESQLQKEASALRKKVSSYTMGPDGMCFVYNGNSWIARKSHTDYSINVYPLSENGKIGKKVAKVVFGGFNRVRLQIALEIIK